MSDPRPPSNIHLAAEDVHKAYALGVERVEVLRGVTLTVARGETLAIVGASGAGKSTLLNVLGGLEAPSAGRVRLDGRDLYSASESERARLRARRVGFVFQAYHLLPELDVVDNVRLPALAARGKRRDAAADRRRATELLDRMGLGHRRKHRPDELSGGEQQRAAIARALMNDPDLLLADEPTGNLDSETGAQVLDSLFDLVRERPRTVVLVTHNPDLAARCARVVHLRDGRVEAVRD